MYYVCTTFGLDGTGMQIVSIQRNMYYTCSLGAIYILFMELVSLQDIVQRER